LLYNILLLTIVAAADVHAAGNADTDAAALRLFVYETHSYTKQRKTPSEFKTVFQANNSNEKKPLTADR
jgi:hypothetical protein